MLQSSTNSLSLQHTQKMDVLVRFWSEPQRKVQVKIEYLGSVFTCMGRAIVDDLVDSFESMLSKLGMLNLVQVSVDRPNVN